MHTSDITMDKWEHPDSYAGFNPIGDYGVLGRNRDSSTIDESNWAVACKELGAVAYDEGDDDFANRPPVYHWRASHWLCGWVEYLMVRQDAPDEVLEKAQEIVNSIADYPVLDDEHFSNLEDEQVQDWWKGESLSWRVGICRDVGVSIFAARRDWPSDDEGRLYEHLREAL